MFKMRPLFAYFSFMLTFALSISGMKTMAGAGLGDWVAVGIANESASPYNFYYYKLVQLNNNAHRYASILEVSIQADANYFDRQGSFQIRVDKYEGTTGRFDGLEITCISGNPSAGTFYVFNNALWIRSNYQWGTISYRSVADFVNSPLNVAPFNQTLTMPTGYLATTSSYGLKCDFDSNHFYQLPFQDVKGNITVAGNVGIGTTTPQARLAVNGDLFAKRVKVIQTGWPDFVFRGDYRLPTLQEVEKFIEQNKHLPDVPSEKEVNENGLDVGEINKKLLLKVEELTLYIIGLKKESEAQRRRLEVLERAGTGRR